MITYGPQVIISDGSLIQATRRTFLNLKPLLTKTSRREHIYPHLQPGAFIPIRKLCDDGCSSTLTYTHLNLVKDGLTVLEGTWSITSGMW